MSANDNHHQPSPDNLRPRQIKRLGPLLTALLLFAAPHSSAKEAKSAKHPAQATQWARHYSLVQTLKVPQAEAFARLSPAQLQTLSDLTQRSAQRINLYVQGERLLLILPPSHPAGKLELLLNDDQGRLEVFSPERRFHASLALARLPDVLDRAVPSLREDFQLEPREEQTDATARDESVSAGDALPVDQLVKQIRLSYTSPSRRGTTRSLLLSLRAELAPATGPQPYAQALWPIALPLLCDRAGSGLLEELAGQQGRLLRWQLSVANLSPSAPVPPVFETTVEDHGYVLLPQARFATSRPDYRELDHLPPPSGPGLQSASAKLLGHLRSAPPSKPLEVENKSDTAAQLYLDGALLGWVAAGQSMSFKGLAEGYYRVYAVSPSGARSWGPIDTYIPGPLTLR